MKKKKKPLSIGDTVPPYGEIGAVGWISGERYFWFVDKHGSVAMMPAAMFE